MRASRAWAHARIRAAKSRLLRRQDVLPLLSAPDEDTRARVLATLPDASMHARAAYELAMRVHPESRGVFEALLRLRAIEQVKVAWRNGEPVHAPDLVAPIDTAVLESIRRTSGTDTAAAELALDRWGSRQLLDRASALPSSETLARRLLESVVRERDNELLRRGSTFRGLTGAQAQGLTLLQHEAVNPRALREERKRLCRRAFVGHTFELAPSIAFVLLHEAEARGLRALTERALDGTTDETAEGVLAAGLLAREER